MQKDFIISKIVAIELGFFKSTKSITGPAPCQSQANTFLLARTAQWNLYPEEVLNSYMNDLQDALNNNANLVTRKYAYMMRSTSPLEFEQIKHKLPTISEYKKKMVESIVIINMFWEEEIRKNHLELINKNRPLYTKDDSLRSVSVETYLRGELLTYSEKTLELLVKFYKECFENKINLVYKNLKFLSEKKNSSEHKLKLNTTKSSIENLNISLKDAELLKKFAFEKAEEINIPITITVLDSTGNIILTQRMDNAIIVSIDISKNKAFTAFYLNENTYNLQKNEEIKNVNLQKINGNILCFLGGGFPINTSNKLIGSIGISGGSVEQDIKIAEYALNNWYSIKKLSL